MRLEAFGKCVELDLDDSIESDVLRDELSLYTTCSAREPDLRISYRPDLPPSTTGLTNPALHHEASDGFTADYGTVRVRYRFTDTKLSAIDFSLLSEPKIKRAVGKARNIQFTSIRESIGQYFHELVMVPTAFFDPSLAVIHASAVASPRDEALLIAGTGGVGKTSASIELCLEQGFRFLADDISIVSRNGRVWPNLAYPKIYGYNAPRGSLVATRLFAGRPFLDSLQWRVKYWRDPKQVRRRVSPRAFYGNYEAKPAPCGRILFLVREYRDATEVEAIPPARAAALNASVMASEYGVFFRHVAWHEFNCEVAGREPTITMSRIRRNLLEAGKEALAESECLLVRLPMELDHRELVSAVAEIARR